MRIELAVLTWGCVLALVHVFAAGHVKTRQYGKAWNVGARDETLPPPAPIVGRMARAQANFFETFPVVVALILLDVQLGLLGSVTAVGALLWLCARIVYLPLYAAGIPVVRTLAFTVSMIGIVMLFWPALAAMFG
jgi:uncharacterized MAPEG superfamily protein